MEWSNDLVSEFLELYEKEPSIWNPSDPWHKNRNNIQDSWKNISDNLSVKFSISELKKKKDSLMSTFRKLASKVRASKKTESGTDDVYKPDWFANEKMATFLHGVFQPRMTISSEVNIIYLVVIYTNSSTAVVLSTLNFKNLRLSIRSPGTNSKFPIYLPS